MLREVLDKIEKKKIKELAICSIKVEFEQDEKIIKKIERIEKELNKIEAGVFVTLKVDGKLRGCIGFPYKKPLGKAVKEASKLSAFYDPRFLPLNKDELKKIDVEITLLSEPEEIKEKEIEKILKEIEIGKHGLMIKSNRGSGLLLPQVALEYNMDPITFLEATCLKAGLNKDAWIKENVKIFKFEGFWF